MKIGFRALQSALSLLTRLPLPPVELDDRDLARGVMLFPVVGALLGVFYAAAAAVLGALGIGPLGVATSVVAIQLIATGALHEDGLADSADAIGGAWGDRDRFFEIAKDSRIGTYGAAALMTSLMLRVSLYAEAHERLAVMIILSETLSRAGCAWLLATSPYVTPTHLRSNFGFSSEGSVGITSIMITTGITILPLITFLDRGLVGVLLTSIIVTFAGVGIARWQCNQIAGGVTGDLLGALQQILVAITLLCLSMSPRAFI